MSKTVEEADKPNLADARRVTEAATEGPWTYGGQGWVFAAALIPDDGRSRGMRDLLASIGTNDDDAEFIAASRTLVPALLAAVEAVLAVHRPVERGRVEACCEGCEKTEGGCVAHGDCPTVRAITAHLDIEEQR